MKRMICMVLSLLLLAVTVFSAAAQENMKILVTCTSSGAGEVVTARIGVENNPGIISIKVKLSYDATLLSLEQAEGGDFSGVGFSPLTNNPLTVNWVNGLQGNNTTNGTLAVLTFRVKSTVAGGTQTAFSLEANAADVFNNDLQSVGFTCLGAQGIVLGQTPQPPIPPTNTDLPHLGDVNGDGEVNAKDALAVLKISVNKMIPTPAQTRLADVNLDTLINAKDALEILKYSVNKPSCIPQ